MTIFITGGAGSIGSGVVKELLKRGEQMVIFDSNEYGLAKLKSELGTSFIDYVLGSLKDRMNIERCMRVESDVIHFASLKNMAVTEQNPRETIYSNVIGTLNLIETADMKGARKFLTISSDKSVDYSSIYGASKFLQEKITLSCNKWKYNIAARAPDGKYSVIRLCNVKETRGNVFELWAKQKSEGKALTVTSPDMRRYFMTNEQATKSIIKAFDVMNGGELFIPDNMEEVKMIDLAKEISDNIEIVGVREGEKLREKVMTDDEERKAIRGPSGLLVIKN